MMTQGQKAAYDAVIEGYNVFITGGAGVGKSYLVNQLITDLSDKNLIVCAPTGAAASKIKGCTIHNAFRFPTGYCFSDKTGKIMAHTTQPLLHADTILIDEISMVRMDMFDAIYASLQKIKKKTGRMPQIVVVGDFYQLSPVLNDSSILEKHYGYPVGNAYAFQAPSWKKLNFRCYELTEVVRQKDEELIHNLNLARIGNPSCIQYFNERSSRVPIPKAVTLYPYNKDVNAENNLALQRLNTPACTFPSIGDSYTITLKEGALVMLTSNDKYPNGTTGFVTKMYKHPTDPFKDNVTLDIQGESYRVYRKVYETYTYELEGERLVRKVSGQYFQFPIKLAYALTTHKAQGQTYEAMNCCPDAFCYGQLYVTLSRITNIENLYLTKPITPGSLMCDPVVQDFYMKTDFMKYKKVYMPKTMKSVGRPVRFPSGTRQRRMPLEIDKHLDAVIDTIFPKDYSGINDEKLQGLINYIHENFPA